MAKRRALLLPLLGAAAATAVILTALTVDRVNPDPPLLLQPAAEAPSRSVQGPLDLNAATAEELEALPGVGPALAESILAWREEHGPFLQREDVLDVPGVGPGIYEKIAPYLKEF